MPPPSKLLSLADDVLEQLDERLRQSQFSNYQAHSEWLQSLGHTGGKTTIHAYAQAHRQRIKSRTITGSPAQLAVSTKSADQRIECLKVAASLVPVGVPVAQIKDVAGDLYNWANRT